ncbi:hypothetical protein Salat_2777200 [Sesamum alatum]|uniref:Uncharacterized protein n=1 Tax=Sesamum alatum TaxID=300844 RepID=A0AAE2C943_9LAMI|nr:hypothetical protein Salat_2777200 [Sesamum alatum]
MELIVREVYRAVKSYANMKINSTRKEKLMLTALSGFPCGLRFAGFTVEEYPLAQDDVSVADSEMLVYACTPEASAYTFQSLAERKNNTVCYEGEIAVSDVIKFLAAHGSRVLDLLMDKSSLQDQKSVIQGPQSRSLHHEVLLKDDCRMLGVKYQFNAQLAVSSHQRLSYLLVVF